MLLFGVLCLTVGVLANPTMYVPRASLEYPLSWTIPSVAIVEAEEKVPGVPEAPKLEVLPLVKAFQIGSMEEKEEGEKREEKDEESVDKIEVERESEQEDEKDNEKVLDMEIEKEKETEMEKHEDMAEEPKKPVIVNLEVPKIPEFITNFWANLPGYLPQITLPHITFPTIISKPRGTMSGAETAKYRLAYEYPFVSSSRIRITEKK